MQDKYTILKQYFGYTSFRSGQEEIVDALLRGQDAVGIMPTGAGKSLCFQVPALLLDGVTLVVSPLISLMKDQVNALTQAGIPAAYINSTLTQAQLRKVLENARQEQYKILYVAPERLTAPSFLEYAQQAPIALVSIDEAHCVSQWGQDFRPSYLRIDEFIRQLPGRPVLGAFTATATTQVQDDIIQLLRLNSPQVVSTGFDRENLYFEVQKPKSKQSALAAFLETRRDKSGIVYCLTRKTVEEVCAFLCRQGYDATRYHAGLPDGERKENQELFQADKARIMVATNAFGMGIDKSNVSFVVHYNMPKNIESYYQEAGRAGRDGSPAECVLFYSGQDVITNQFFIDKARENDELRDELLEEFKQAERLRLRTMTFYCHTGDCLREYLLRYFGQSSSGYCGNCSNCLHHFEKADITVEAQKILSCVKRMGERYGVKLVVDTLRGMKNERVLTLGFDSLSTYGIMREVTEKRLRDIINHLVLQDYLLLTDSEYPVLRLGAKAKGVLFGGETLLMNLPKEEQPKRERSARQKAAVVNPRLYAKLQGLRSRLAKSMSVPAYVIFTDASLRDMCQKLPRDEEELLQVSGVGQVKLERYGEAFLTVIREETEAHTTAT